MSDPEKECAIQAARAYLETLDFSDGSMPHDRDSLDEYLREAFIVGYLKAIHDTKGVW